MRKFSFFAVTILILAGIGAWTAWSTPARIVLPMNGRGIDPLQIMTSSKNMPNQHFLDYSLIYAK